MNSAEMGSEDDVEDILACPDCPDVEFPIKQCTAAGPWWVVPSLPHPISVSVSRMVGSRGERKHDKAYS